MKKKENKITIEDLIGRIKCHRLLNECIDFNHIEDEAFICKNLNKMKKYRAFLSPKMNSDIEKFIKEVIHPIVYDANYFDFTIRDEFGAYDEKGHFVVNSERSLEKIILLLYAHTLELREKLDDFAMNHLYINLR